MVPACDGWTADDAPPPSVGYVKPPDWFCAGASLLVKRLGPEVDEMFPNRFSDEVAVVGVEAPAGFVCPNKLPVLGLEEAPKRFEGAAVGAEVWLKLWAGAKFPKRLVFCSAGLFRDKTGPPLVLVPALLEGGGPAGVVDTVPNEKAPPGLLGAGVVLPTWPEVIPAFPNRLLVPGGLAPPKRLVDVPAPAVEVSTGLLGVENPENAPFPFGPPRAVLPLAPCAPNIEPVCPVLAPPPISDCCPGTEVVVPPPPKRFEAEDVGVPLDAPEKALPGADGREVFDANRPPDVLLAVLVRPKRPELPLLVAGIPKENVGLDLGWFDITTMKNVR